MPASGFKLSAESCTALILSIVQHIVYFQTRTSATKRFWGGKKQNKQIKRTNKQTNKVLSWLKRKMAILNYFHQRCSAKNKIKIQKQKRAIIKTRTHNHRLQQVNQAQCANLGIIILNLSIMLTPLSFSRVLLQTTGHHTSSI